MLLVVSAALSVIFLPLLFPLFRSLYSPLHKIPLAHWSCCFSNLYILLIRYRSCENATLLSLHRKLGPIVLLSPSEISVNDLSGLRTIYVGGWQKPDWYLMFQNFEGTPNMFSMLDGKAHSARKRIVSGLYAKSNLLYSQGMERIRLEIMMKEFLPWLQEVSKRSEPTRAYNILGRVALDAMSAFVFGRDCSTRYIQDEAGWTLFKNTYEERGKWAFITQELPAVERYVGLGASKSRLARAWVDNWCAQMCLAAEERGSRGAIPCGEAEVWRALTRGVGEEGREAKETAKLVSSEIIDQLLAGHETTAIALTFCLYHLSINKVIQQALHEELNSLTGPFRTNSLPHISSSKEVDSLPLLSAIVTETLRLNAPIPGPQPRVTSDGVFLNGIGKEQAFMSSNFLQFAAKYYVFMYDKANLLMEDLSLEEYEYLPMLGGMINYFLHHCILHRNEAIYPNPEEWKPDRWMKQDMENHAEDETNRLKDMQRWFWAFGSGGRMCVGSNFALIQMKTTLAVIYTNFKTDIVDASGIEQMDGYTVGPKDELIVKFSMI